MKLKNKRTILFSILLILSICFSAMAQSPEADNSSDSVPALYSDLYTQLNGDLNDFQGAVNKVSNGSKYPVAFAGQLTVANSNNGPKLLDPSSMQLIQEELQLFKTIGVEAVSVEVSFPMLYQPFLG